MRNPRRAPLGLLALALLVGSLVLIGPGSTPVVGALPACPPQDQPSIGICLHGPTDDPDDYEQQLTPGAGTAPQIDDYNNFRLHRTTYTPSFRHPVCPSKATYEIYDADNPPPVDEMPCSSPAFVSSYSTVPNIGGRALNCKADCVLDFTVGAGTPTIAALPTVTAAVWNEWSREFDPDLDRMVTVPHQVRQDREITLPQAAPTTPPIVVLDITPTGKANEYVVSPVRSYSTTQHALLVTTWFEFSDGFQTVRQTPSPVTHTFTGPPPYSVKVTVEDARLSKSSLERVVEDHLSVVGVLLGEASPEPNSTTTATVAVTNDGIGPVTNVVPTLTADPAERIVATGGPAPASATLALGETNEFTFEVDTGSAGKVLLTGGASGIGSKGPVPVTQKQIEYDVGLADLQVSLEVPDRVGLERDPDTNELIPKDVDLKVHLKNLTSGTLRDIALRDGDPVQLPDEGVVGLPFRPRDTVPPPVRTVGSLGPDQEVTLTLPYRAELAGGVDWLLRADATVGEAPDTEEITRTATARSEVGDEGALLVKLTKQTTPVRAGDDWVLRGTIKNITNDATIQLDWVRTKQFGNAAGAWVVDAKAPPAIGASVPPELEAGETWAFSATVHTAVGMDALSSIELAPTGTLRRADQDEVDLTVDDIAFDGPKRISAQMITPTFDPSEQLTWGSVVGNFEYSLFSTLYEGLVGLKELPRLIGNVGENAFTLYATTARLDYLVTQYDNLPPQARDEWIDATYASLEAQYGAGDRVLEGVRDQIATWFSDLRFAIDTGDLNQLSRIGGSATANIFDSEIFGAFLKVIKPKWNTFLVTKAATFEDAAKADAITDAAVALERMEAAPNAAAAEIAADDLRKGLVSGAPVVGASAKLWGLSQETYDFLARLARQRGYLITLRARGIGALEKLRAGYLPKMELIKLKNVDPIDTTYLGYLADDLNTVVLKKPPVLDVKEVEGWVAANVADPAARAGVAERLTTRVEEWKKVQQGKPGYEYLKYAEQKYMPVPFNVAENLALPFSKAWNKRAVSFLKGLQDTLAGKAKFELAEVAGHPGYFRLQVNGRGITGDIDFMDFRKATGEPLTELERLRLYRDLADGTRGGIVQLQHPVTIIWFLDSAAWFNAKKKYIEEFAGPRSDTLLQFSPEAGGSARAVRYDPARSQIQLQGGENIWRYEGGFTSPQRFRVGVSDLSFIGSITHTLSAALEDLWGPPTTWLVDPDQPGAQRRAAFAEEPTDGRVPVAFHFSTDPGAVVARAGWDHLEYWTRADGWQPAPSGGSASLALMPQTAVAADVAKGASSLAILAPDAATTGPTAPGAWFAPGQQVVINPGGATEEVRTVSGVAPLRFTQPLARPHLRGEVVSVVAAAPAVVPTTPTTPPTEITAVPTPPAPSTSTQPPPASSSSGSSPSPADGSLPRTGTDVGDLAPLGIALVTAGSAILAVRRRRRTTLA
jgi:hypothetical protein